MIQLTAINLRFFVPHLQKTILKIQLRLQVYLGRRLTQSDLAALAGTTDRTMAEWMRGGTPRSLDALMNLLARLPKEDANLVLEDWRNELSTDSATDPTAASKSQ